MTKLRPSGGYSEQLATARLEQRKQKQSDQVPRCPNCGSVMVLRTAHAGKNSGHQFWGCSSYPECKGVRTV